MVRLTILGSNPVTDVAQLVRINGQLAAINSPHPVEIGSIVRLDTGEALVVGECRRCDYKNSQHEVGIAIQHVIPLMSDLAKLMTALGNASQPVSIAQNEPKLPARS